MGVKSYLAQHRAGYRTLRELIEDIAQHNNCTTKEATLVLGRLISKHDVQAYRVSQQLVAPYPYQWRIGRVITEVGTKLGLNCSLLEYISEQDRRAEEV